MKYQELIERYIYAATRFMKKEESGKTTNNPEQKVRMRVRMKYLKQK